MTGTRLHRIWVKMKQRCHNPNDPDYVKWYGSRGITVCEEWKNDFKAFYDWSMSHGYSDDLTIDRIDNDGNYEPNNCRWVDYKFQANNRRNNVKYEGSTIEDLVKNHDVKPATLRFRINHSIPNPLNYTDRVGGTRLSMIKNHKLNKSNTSGHNGIYFRTDTKKWSAYIWLNYKKINLGCFNNIEDAIAARKSAEEKYYNPILIKHGGVIST